MKRQGKLHYAWLICINCILLKVGVGGAVYCITGNFVTPAVQELGCSVSQFTMLVSVEAVSMALLYSMASRVLNQGNIGRIIGFGILIQALGIGLMGAYQRVGLIYISGALVGMGAAFTGFVAIPIVINMWFREKAGLALGIIVASENVATILYSLLTAEWIVRYGWRMAYVLVALMALALSLPAAFLMKRPEEVGSQPYGAGGQAEDAVQEPEWSLTRKEAVRKPLFYLIWFVGMCYSTGYSVQQYTATFATMELGQSITFGTRAVMFMGLGFIVSSIALGFINDKFGAKAGLGYGAVCILVGYSCMLFSIQNPDFCIPASLIVGFGGSMYSVQAPLVARTALGGKHFASIWSLMMMGNSLVGAIGYAPIGLFYDISGSYRGAFLMNMGLYAAAFICGSIAITMGKRGKERA